MNYSRKTLPSVLLLFIGMFLLRFWPFLLGKTLIFGDTFSYYVPGKIFTASQLREGVLPVWNEYLLTGISWIGDLNQSIFSVSTLLFSLFDPASALNFTIMLHLLIGFAGMYWLGRHYTNRRLGAAIAATAWMYSGVVSQALGNPSVLQSLSFIPWVVVAGVYPQGRFGVGIGIVAMSLAILGGYPQLIPYGLLVALLFDWYEHGAQKPLHMLARWTFVIGASALLTSFILIPFISTLRSSTRVIQSSVQASEGTLHVADLVSIVVPNLFIHERQGIKWGPQWNNMGHVVLFVPWTVLYILLARRSRLSHPEGTVLVALAASSILLALIPVVSYLPILKFARGPSHALVIFALCVPLLCALVLTRVRSLPSVQGRYLLGVLLGIWIVALSVSSNMDRLWNFADTRLAHRISNSAFHTVQRDARIIDNIFTTVLTQALLSVLLFFALRAKRSHLILFFFALQYHTATSAALFFAPKTVYPTWVEISQKRQEYAQVVGNERVLFANGNVPYSDVASYMDALTVRAPFSDSFVDDKELRTFAHLQAMRETLTPNWGMVYGVRTFNAYVALFPRSVATEFSTSANTPILNTLPPIATDSALLSRYGVRYVVTDPWYPSMPMFASNTQVGSFGRAGVYRREEESK